MLAAPTHAGHASRFCLPALLSPVLPLLLPQFENALATLRQLEGQYSALSAESAAAEKARSARIQQLEGEVDALRAAQAAAQQEQEAAVRRGWACGRWFGVGVR